MLLPTYFQRLVFFSFPFLLGMMACNVSNPIDRAQGEEKKAQTQEDSKIENGVKVVEMPNGLKMEATFKDGKKNGPARYYYKSGQVYKESHYKNDHLNGKTTVYDRKGNVLRTTEYKDRQKHGYEEIYYKSGKKKQAIKYYENWPLPGLFRRSVTGEILPEPKIIMNRIPHPSGHPYKFDVQFTLNENFREVKFYVLKENLRWEDLAHNTKARTKCILNIAANSTGKITHYLQKGTFVINEPTVYAVFEIKKDVAACVKQSFKYSFQN